MKLVIILLGGYLAFAAVAAVLGRWMLHKGGGKKKKLDKVPVYKPEKK